MFSTSTDDQQVLLVGPCHRFHILKTCGKCKEGILGLILTEFGAELNVSIAHVICCTNHIWPLAEKLLGVKVTNNLQTFDDARIRKSSMDRGHHLEEDEPRTE